MTQEALKLALEALERFEGNKKLWPEAITAIKEALAQEQEPVALQYPQKDIDWQREQQIKAQASTPPQGIYYTPPQRTEQEPVTWADYESNGMHHKPVAWMDADGNVSDNNDHKCFPIPLYTHPPQRTWVGLTDEQLRTEFGKLYPNDIGILELAENNRDFAVEAIGARHHWVAFQAGARAAEAKLKEKNNGV